MMPRHVPVGYRLVALAAVLVAGMPLLAEKPATETEPAEAAVTEDREDDGVSPPQVILASQTPPLFPPAALAGRFSGTVTVELTVAPDGRVGGAKVVDCTHTRVGFEEASLEAVKQWRFVPATHDGLPVEYTMRFNLNFRGQGRYEGTPFVSVGTLPDDRGRSEVPRSESPTPRAPAPQKAPSPRG